MDLVTTARVLARHWLLSAVALLAAIGVTGIVYLKVPTTYSGNAIVLLQAPTTGGTYHPPPVVTPKPAGSVKPGPTTESNPYLSVDSSLWVLAKLIAQDLGSDKVKGDLEKSGPKLNYQVTAQSDVPAVGIAVVDTNRARIVAKLQEIITLATADLKDRQQATGVPQETWVTATPSVVPLTMDRTKDKLKMLIAVAAVALGAAVALVFITESVQAGARRRERRRLLEQLEDLREQRQREEVQKAEQAMAQPVDIQPWREDIDMMERPVEIPHYG